MSLFDFDFKIDENAAETAGFGGGKVGSGIYDCTLKGLFVSMDKSFNPRCTVVAEGANGEKIRIFEVMIAANWNKKDKSGNLLMAEGKYVPGAENVDYAKFQALMVLAKGNGRISEIENKTAGGTVMAKSFNFDPSAKMKLVVYREFDAYTNQGGENVETDKLKLSGVLLPDGRTIGEAKVGAEAEEINRIKCEDNYTKRWKQLIENAQDVGQSSTGNNGFGDYGQEKTFDTSASADTAPSTSEEELPAWAR